MVLPIEPSKRRDIKLGTSEHNRMKSTTSEHNARMKAALVGLVALLVCVQAEVAVQPDFDIQKVRSRNTGRRRRVSYRGARFGST